MIVIIIIGTLCYSNNKVEATAATASVCAYISVGYWPSLVFWLLHGIIQSASCQRSLRCLLPVLSSFLSYWAGRWRWQCCSSWEAAGEVPTLWTLFLPLCWQTCAPAGSETSKVRCLFFGEKEKAECPPFRKAGAGSNNWLKSFCKRLYTERLLWSLLAVSLRSAGWCYLVTWDASWGRAEMSFEVASLRKVETKNLQ